jgi:hypothetical protein
MLSHGELCIRATETIEHKGFIYAVRNYNFMKIRHQQKNVEIQPERYIRRNYYYV